MCSLLGSELCEPCGWLVGWLQVLDREDVARASAQEGLCIRVVDELSHDAVGLGVDDTEVHDRYLLVGGRLAKV